MKYNIPKTWKVISALIVIPLTLVFTYDVRAADATALIDEVPNVSFLRDLSITGLFGLFLFAYLNERKSQHKKDELITTKLIATLENNSIAMTKVVDAVDSFHKNCLSIQKSLQHEVERMQLRNDS